MILYARPMPEDTCTCTCHIQGIHVTSVGLKHFVKVDGVQYENVKVSGRTRSDKARCVEA